MLLPVIQEPDQLQTRALQVTTQDRQLIGIQETITTWVLEGPFTSALNFYLVVYEISEEH